jgi:cation:H+ antiporter
MVWLVLFAGLFLLIAGAELLVKGAARLAANFGIPALVVGLTVVAFGTSAPELAVSMKAAFSGQVELAIANVVGSNIFNILFILGIAGFIAPLVVSQQLVRQDVPVMVAISMIVVLMALNGRIERIEAGVLVLGLLVYTAFLFYQGKKQGIDQQDEQQSGTAVPAWQNLLFIITGLILLVIGARWLVESAVSIASTLGVSEAVIGLTIVAAGTSLPEVMTSVIATIKGQRDIAIGNVIGSNVFNILCVLGLSALVSPEPLLAGVRVMQIDLPVMLAVSALCLPLFFAGASLSRFEGFIFLLLYSAYIWYTIAVAISADYLAVLQTGILFGLIPVVAVYAAAVLLVHRRSQL